MTFSIITVTYNNCKNLKKTIESVLSQSETDYEHIIIDGNSSDETISEINKYNHLKFISEKDNGIYDAMNKGIRIAEGEYICFLNAGDKLSEEKTLEKIKNCINKHNSPIGIIYGETDIVDSDGNFIEHRRLRAPKSLNWRSFKKGMLVCHQSIYVKNSIAKSISYNLKYKYSSDQDWCIRVMKWCEKNNHAIINSNEILTNYLSEGATTQNHITSLIERFIIYCNHYGIATTLFMHFKFAISNIIPNINR